MTTRILIAISLLFSSTTLLAQDDLLKELNGLEKKETEYVSATFKGTRLINFHTIETLKKRSLDFRISHRFGDVSTGADNLWGIDGPATLRLGLDYSLTDNLVIGMGRSSYQKVFDGFAKYKIKKQEYNGYPISIVALGSMNITTDSDPNKDVAGADRYKYFSSRVAYMAQLMVARKFNSRLSFQFSPTFIHYNMVTRANDKNDMAALAFMGRYKITKSIAFTSEYSTVVTRYAPDDSRYKDVFSVGLDIETGGHVFQLFFTNAAAINEVQLIPFTTSDWTKSEFRFGFNISRVFQFTNGSSK